MSDSPRRILGTLLDGCLALLLAAMALWGALEIIRAIWVYLCILLAVIAIIGVISRIIARQFRRW